MYIYEFEFFEEEGLIVALPFDLEHYATQGTDMADAIEMAADLVKSVVEDALMNDETLPEPSYGHSPRHNGKIMVIAVEASLDTVKAMPASAAAVRLGISRGRVSNMLRDGVLEGFRKGRDSFVTVASVEQRLKTTIRAGRPSKTRA
ncbi:MAG: helix-turn-helix domain-containing protein [Coriobacteriales bacterium]|nr:helix-turn-helix domain-containing protein [Coriobacteriales bacterium]